MMLMQKLFLIFVARIQRKVSQPIAFQSCISYWFRHRVVHDIAVCLFLHRSFVRDYLSRRFVLFCIRKFAHTIPNSQLRMSKVTKFVERFRWFRYFLSNPRLCDDYSIIWNIRLFLLYISRRPYTAFLVLWWLPAYARNVIATGWLCL